MKLQLFQLIAVVDFDILLGQHLNYVILYCESGTEVGMDLDGVRTLVSAVVESQEYASCDFDADNYGNKPYAYFRASGQ